MTPDETRVFGRALGAIGRLLASLDNDQRVWLDGVPVRRAMEAFDDYPPWAEYDFVSADVEAIDAEVRLLGGADWVRRYWQLVTLHFVVRSSHVPRDYVIPPSILELLVVDLDRIVEAAATGAGPEDPLAHGGFLLDLAMARGAAIPMDTFVGVPCIAPETVEGFPAGRWLNMHLRWDASKGFSPATIQAVAPFNIDFHLANPECLGWFGITWLADPQLSEVSPHLSWYRELMLAAGAEIVPSGTDEQTIALATATSQTRRGAFEEGQYQPRDYRIVMRREHGLRWYETTAGLLPSATGEPTEEAS
jgi:hypothetical protein